MTYFTLGRKIDPTYKTNLIILIMTLTLLVAMGIFTMDWGASLVFSAGFFLTWALAREIDPLHDTSAFVAAAAYLVMTVGTIRTMETMEINLGLVFWTVLLLRGITKITGKTITLVDLLGLTGLGIYVMMGQENGIYGMIFTAAMVMGYTRFPKHKTLKTFIGVGVILSVWGVISYSIPVPEAALQMNSFRGVLLLLGLGLGIFYGGRLRKDQGIRDDLGEIMESSYVFLSYIFYLGMYVALITATDLGDGTLSLFFAVILGVSFYRGWLSVSKR